MCLKPVPQLSFPGCSCVPILLRDAVRGACFFFLKGTQTNSSSVQFHPRGFDSHEESQQQERKQRERGKTAQRKQKHTNQSPLITAKLSREVILPASHLQETQQLLEAARTDHLQVQAILNGQLDDVESWLRAAQVAFLVNRSPREGTGSEPSAGALGVDTQRTSGVHPCTTRRGAEDDGHSYAGTVVRGGIGSDRHDD